jgi:hypothetical protein
MYIYSGVPPFWEGFFGFCFGQSIRMFFCNHGFKFPHHEWSARWYHAPQKSRRTMNRNFPISKNKGRLTHFIQPHSRPRRHVGSDNGPSIVGDGWTHAVAQMCPAKCGYRVIWMDNVEPRWEDWLTAASEGQKQSGTQIPWLASKVA